MLPLSPYQIIYHHLSSLLLSPVFLTGCDRVPFMGMKSIKMRVAVLPDATEIHFPESLTCHHLLLLPIYQRYPVERTMSERLRQAIYHNRGFLKKWDTAGWRSKKKSFEIVFFCCFCIYTSLALRWLFHSIALCIMTFLALHSYTMVYKLKSLNMFMSLKDSNTKMCVIQEMDYVA